MQPLGRTSTAGTVYSATQVSGYLTAGNATERWVFDRLSAAGVYLSDLTPYVDLGKPPVIAHDAAAATHRTLRLQVRGDAPLNYLQDLIRVHYQLLAPDGGWLDFPLGTFVTTPPDKQISQAVTWGQLHLSDLSQLLIDASFSYSFAVKAGTNYISAINQVVQSYGGPTPIVVRMLDPGLTVPAALTWDAGVTRLKAVTDLLAGINYNAPWFDELGFLRSEPVPDYNVVAASFTFDSTQGASILKDSAQSRVDLTRSFNQVSVLVEDPRRNRFYVTYSNTDPASAISLVNWHPKTKLIRDSRLVDATRAQARAKAEIQNAARIYAPITFRSFPWPASQNLDVYGITFATAGEALSANRYLETRWTMTCATGADTLHEVTQIVVA